MILKGISTNIGNNFFLFEHTGKYWGVFKMYGVTERTQWKLNGIGNGFSRGEWPRFLLPPAVWSCLYLYIGICIRSIQKRVNVVSKYILKYVLVISFYNAVSQNVLYVNFQFRSNPWTKLILNYEFMFRSPNYENVT